MTDEPASPSAADPKPMNWFLQPNWGPKSIIPCCLLAFFLMPRTKMAKERDNYDDDDDYDDDNDMTMR